MKAALGKYFPFIKTPETHRRELAAQELPKKIHQGIGDALSDLNDNKNNNKLHWKLFRIQRFPRKAPKRM